MYENKYRTKICDFTVSTPDVCEDEDIFQKGHNVILRTTINLGNVISAARSIECKLALK